MGYVNRKYKYSGVILQKDGCFFSKWWLLYKYDKPKGGVGAWRTIALPNAMGRSKYSLDERTKIITNFLRVTREIIDIEGIEQVSIRKVAKNAGFNSATLYLYFKDADELITLASLRFLENYCRTLAMDTHLLTSDYDVYLHTWKVFCQYAFEQPRVFDRLFFFPHSIPLEDTIKRYYEIYPHQLDSFDGVVKEMLYAGSLASRNMKVLHPLVDDGYIQEKDVDLINDITVCYFRKLLEDQCAQGGALASERLTEQLLSGIEFLLHKPENVVRMSQ